MFNLNDRDIKEQKKDKKKKLETENGLSLWDTHLSDFEVSPNAGYVGSRLCELAWREKFGINIAYIKRGDNIIPIPQEDDKVFPFDKLGLIGTDEQIKNFELNMSTTT